MTIAEVCKRFGMSADTLRYYEKAGLIPAVRRTSGGIRDYTDYDCGWIDFIKCMRSAGVRVESLVEYVRLFGQGDATTGRRKQILIDERARIAGRIAEMQAILCHLDVKIERYESDVFPVEKELTKAMIAR
jgi:DNA-binding transcriptional MerR regulator